VENSQIDFVVLRPSRIDHVLIDRIFNKEGENKEHYGFEDENQIEIDRILKQDEEEEK